MANNLAPPCNTTVITRYEAAYPIPFSVKKGDQLNMLIPPEDWPDWCWCQAESGEKRWVPLEFLTIKEEIGIMKRAYDSTELTAERGERLAVLEIVAGWAWCRRESGQTGWLPIDNLELGCTS